MNQLNKILIILIIVFLVVLGIRFIHYQNIKYQEQNKKTVVEEEIESKIEDKQTEKIPIKSLEQEEYEEEDSIMIF